MLGEVQFLNKTSDIGIGMIGILVEHGITTIRSRPSEGFNTGNTKCLD